MIKTYIFLCCFVLCLTCGDSGKTETNSINNSKINTLFTQLSADSTGVDFFNKVANKKNFNIFKYRNFYNGGGVAIGDINNDGLSDVYFTGNMVGNKLYLNKGDFKFEDISETANVVGDKPWSTGVVMVDINQDGLLDIYVSNAGNLEGNNHDNDLYINNGDLTFTEKAAEYNLAKTGFSTHASFFDYDKDGDLDAYILNNSNIPVSSLGYAAQRKVRAQNWENVPEIFRGVGDMLLRNDNGKFVDVSEDAGIYGSLIGFGLGVMVTDINNDLYPDIYISNDFYERDYLYINNQDGTFTEDIKNWVSHLSLSAMGVDIADINNDGDDDIFITDMLPEADQRVKSVMEFEGYNVFKLKQSKDFYQQYIQNTLQLNNGNNTFSEVAYFSGVAKTDWSWAGLLFDMDNDGFRDIFVTNGVNHDLTDLDFVDFFANEIIQKMALTGKKQAIDTIINKMPVKPQPNYAYKNNGDITFSNANTQWGFTTPSLSNGVAYGDLDNDGDLDLVINNVNMPPFIYKNNAETQTNNNHLSISLKGNPKNAYGIGASIQLYYGNTVYKQQQMPSRGFQSSMDYKMVIGLGEAKTIDSLRIIWPSDATQKLTNIKANTTITLQESEAKAMYKPQQNKTQPSLLTEVTSFNSIQHKENAYNDFDYEGLIQKQLSQEGPAMAVADVNNDGNDDVFIGGAANQNGTIYLNLGNGKLKPLPQNAFEEHAFFEDTSAAFFDADGNGTLDLMVGYGGNQVENTALQQVQLYLNNGKGQFTASKAMFPKANTNTAVIAPYDFDADGDVDVFVGARSVIGTYGINPPHLFLENNGDGTFTNTTEKVSFDVKQAGMITDALWADVDNNGVKDLVTVSEWDTPKVFINNGRRLILQTSTFNDMFGMWNTITANDLDNDGDMDFVLGNQGTNVMHKATKNNPVKMWVNDFDNNGTIEQIFTNHADGKDYPIHMKKELTAQLVSLKKQNLKASVYAKKPISALFPEDIFKNSIEKQVNSIETVVALNNGSGNFTIKALPNRVQMSCVCGIVCTDVNNDGHTDMIMAGNNFEFKPQYSRLDANHGSVLLGDGAANFTWQNYNTSGFSIKNEVKHLKVLKDKSGKTYIIAAVNNSVPKLFLINE